MRNERLEAVTKVIHFTTDEYRQLSDAYRESELADTRETFGQNHPLGEFVRQTLGNDPKTELSDYGNCDQIIRYTDRVTVQLPKDQYEQLNEHFEQTPISDNKNGHHALSGNTPMAEYLRRCITQQLED